MTQKKERRRTRRKKEKAWRKGFCWNNQLFFFFFFLAFEKKLVSLFLIRPVSRSYQIQSFQIWVEALKKSRLHLCLFFLPFHTFSMLEGLKRRRRRRRQDDLWSQLTLGGLESIGLTFLSLSFLEMHLREQPVKDSLVINYFFCTCLLLDGFNQHFQATVQCPLSSNQRLR